MNKTLKTRVQLKHDIEENWLKATNFTPLNGEAIIYDADAAHDYPRAKIGDGVTNVNELPWFVGEAIDLEELEKLLAKKADVYIESHEETTTTEKLLSEVQVGENLAGKTLVFPTATTFNYEMSGTINFTNGSGIYCRWNGSYLFSNGFGIWQSGNIEVMFAVGDEAYQSPHWIMTSYTFPEDEDWIIASVTDTVHTDTMYQAIRCQEAIKTTVIDLEADCEYNYKKINLLETNLEEQVENIAGVIIEEKSAELEETINTTIEEKTKTKADAYIETGISLADVKIGDNLSGVTLFFPDTPPSRYTYEERITLNNNYYIGFNTMSFPPTFGLVRTDDYGYPVTIQGFFTYPEMSGKPFVVTPTYTFPTTLSDEFVVTGITSGVATSDLFLQSAIKPSIYADCETNYKEINKLKDTVADLDMSNFATVEQLSTKANSYFTEKTLGNLKIGDDIGGVTVTWENVDITASDFIQGVGIEFGPEEYYDYGGNAQGYMYVIKGDANNFGLYQNDAFGGARYIQSFIGSGSYTFPKDLVVMKINEPALCSQYSKVQYDPGFEVDCEYNYKYKADAYFKKGKSLADVKVGDNLSGVTIYFDQLHPFGRGYSTIYFNKYVEFDGIEFHSCLKYAPDNSEPGNEIFRLYAYWEPASAYGADVYPVNIFCRHPSRGPKNYWLMDSYTFPTVEDDSFVVHSIDGDPAEDGHFCATYFEPVIAIGVEDNYNAIKELETATENKVDKTNTAWRLYGTSQEGIQRFIPYALSQDTPSSIPMRDYKGRLYAQTNDEPINDPTLMDADYQLVNLKYVKENIPVEKGAGAGSMQQKATATDDSVTVTDNGSGSYTITAGADATAEFDIVGYSKNKQYSYRQHVKLGETIEIPETRYFVPDIECNGEDINVAQRYVTLNLEKYGLLDATSADISEASIDGINLLGYIDYSSGYTTNTFILETTPLFKQTWGKQTLTLVVANSHMGQDILNNYTTYKIPVYVFYGITSADELSAKQEDGNGNIGLERYVTVLPDFTNGTGTVIKHHIVEGHFRLMNDIDFNGSSTNENYPRLGQWVNNIDGGSSGGWTHRFKGVFDGCGYSLKNIYMNGKSNLGLIACNSVAGIIKNLFIENATLVGSQTSGTNNGMTGIVCTSNYGLIKNVYATGTIDNIYSQDWAPPALICSKNDNGIMKECGAIVLNCTTLPTNYANAITRSESNLAANCMSIKLQGNPILATSIVEKDEAAKNVIVPGQNFSYYNRAKPIKRQFSTDRVLSDLSFQSFEDYESFKQYGYDEYQTLAKNAPGMLDLINKVVRFNMNNGILIAGGSLNITTNSNIIDTVAIEYPAANEANGIQSAAIGSGTIANGEAVAALGKFNEGIDGNIVEVGTGSAEQKQTALSVREDGRTQVTAMPATPNDVVNLKQLKERYKHRIHIYFNSLSATETSQQGAFVIDINVENDSKFPITDFNYLMTEVESNGVWYGVGSGCSSNGLWGTASLEVTRPGVEETIATYSGLFNIVFRVLTSSGETLVKVKYVDMTSFATISDSVTKIGGYDNESI